MRELRASWLAGIFMLLANSNVARHRIWRRAPERQAMCDAVGDGTDSDVATAHQQPERNMRTHAYTCTATIQLRPPCRVRY